MGLRYLLFDEYRVYDQLVICSVEIHAHGPQEFYLDMELTLTEYFWIKFSMLLITVVCLDNYYVYSVGSPTSEAIFLCSIQCL
jgi:hypothetical protein